MQSSWCVACHCSCSKSHYLVAVCPLSLAVLSCMSGSTPHASFTEQCALSFLLFFGETQEQRLQHAPLLIVFVRQEGRGRLSKGVWPCRILSYDSPRHSET